MNKIEDDIGTLGRTMSRDVISTDVSASMRAELKLFSQHIGNAISSYATQDHTNMTTQSLAHEREKQVNDTETVLVEENNAVVTQESGTAKVIEDDQYSIPANFDTVRDMIHHWNQCVSPRPTLHKSNWRRHLDHKDVKRFSRLKKVIEKIVHMEHSSMNKDLVVQMFESYYSNNNKVLSKLADVFLKTI